MTQRFRDLMSVSGGLVTTLNTVDAAAAQLNFEGLTLAGFAVQRLGLVVSQAGKAMIGGLVSLGKQVITTGSTFERYTQILETLYKSSAKGKQAMNWALSYAATTPYQIGDIMSALTRFSAMNLDIRKQFKGKDGKSREFMSYLGDLAVLAPPEQGMRGMMIGISNLFGGDAGRSFRMRMNFDLKQVLGRKLASDPEGIMKDLVEAAQKMAPNVMEKLFGTWQQTISNVQDQFTRFFYAIAENGAFQKAKDTLIRLYKVIGEITPEQMDRIGKSIASVFSFIWKPIDLLASACEKIIRLLITIARDFPGITKVLAGTWGFIGLFTLATGAVLKFSGTILMALASLAIFYVIMMQNSLANTFFTTSLGKSIIMLGKFFRFISLGTLLFAGFIFAYNKNLFGMRDATQKVFKDVASSWNKMNDVMSGGGIVGWLVGDKTSLRGMEEKFAKIIAFGRILYSILYHNTGDEVWFTKLDWLNITMLGMDDLARVLVMTYGRFMSFARGFEKGFGGVVRLVGGFLQMVMKPLLSIIDKISNKINDLIAKSGKAEIFGIKIGQTKDMDKWERWGKLVGGLVAAFLGFKVIKGIINAIISPFLLLTRAMVKVGEATRYASGGLQGIKAALFKKTLYEDARGTVKSAPYSWNPFVRNRQMYSRYKSLQYAREMEESQLTGQTVQDIIKAPGKMTAKSLAKLGLDREFLKRVAHYDKNQGLLSQLIGGRKVVGYKEIEIGKYADGSTMYGLEKRVLARVGGLWRDVEKDSEFIGKTQKMILQDKIKETALYKKLNPTLGKVTTSFDTFSNNMRTKFGNSFFGKILNNVTTKIGAQYSRMGYSNPFANGTARGFATMGGQVIGAGARGLVGGARKLGMLGGMALNGIGTGLEIIAMIQALGYFWGLLLDFRTKAKKEGEKTGKDWVQALRDNISNGLKDFKRELRIVWGDVGDHITKKYGGWDKFILRMVDDLNKWVKENRAPFVALGTTIGQIIGEAVIQVIGDLIMGKGIAKYTSPEEWENKKQTAINSAAKNVYKMPAWQKILTGYSPWMSEKEIKQEMQKNGIGGAWGIGAEKKSVPTTPKRTSSNRTSFTVGAINIHLTSTNPVDPKEARKVAVQVKKELQKLDKEKKIRTGVPTTA